MHVDRDMMVKLFIGTSNTDMLFLLVLRSKFCGVSSAE